MNAFTLSSSYDKSYNDQLINKINIRMKEKFNSKMGMKLQQFEQLKKQLRVFKQKMFNIQNQNNMQHKNHQAQKCVINNSKTINQEDLIKNTKEEDDVVRRRKIKRLIFQEKKKTDSSLDKNQLLNSPRKKQKYGKRFSMSPLQLKIFRKAKRTKQSLSTINNTLPLKAPSRRTRVKSELKGSSPIMSRQRSDLSAQKMEYECKIKAEQLIDLVKQQQIKQYNKRCLDRLSNDKNKAIYEQALSKIYEIARQKMQNKQQYEVPKQLGINKIFIPKRLQKTQSIKRNQYILPNYDRKGRQLQKCIQRRSYNQIQRGYNGRQRTLQRKVEQNPRNQTQWLSHREYVDDAKNEQKINGWQYDIQNSKQFLI